MKKIFLNFIKTKKRLLIIIVPVILVMILFSIVLIKEKRDNYLTDSIDTNIKYNTNKDFKKEIEQRGLLFKNIECTFDGNESLLSYKIVNKTEADIELGEYELLVKNDKDEILVTISPNIEDVLKKDEEIEIKNTVNIDITDASGLELNLKNINK